MREQTQKREAATSWVGAAYENGRGRMFLALVLLLVALAVVVVNDREFWFGQAETSVADETTPEWNPSAVAQAPAAQAAPAAPVAASPKTTKHAKSLAAPAIAERPVIAATRSVIPPLEVEVVAGATHGTVHLGNNPEKVDCRWTRGLERWTQPHPTRVRPQLRQSVYRWPWLRLRRRQRNRRILR